jgi:hypothetical protein
VLRFEFEHSRYRGFGFSQAGATLRARSRVEVGAFADRVVERSECVEFGNFV